MIFRKIDGGIYCELPNYNTVIPQQEKQTLEVGVWKSDAETKEIDRSRGS